MALPKFWHMYRLTRPAELTYSGAGMAICKVVLVCSEKYKEKETQLWIDATAFKNTAEALSGVQKGHRVHVLGQISTDSWQDKDTGQKRSKTVMIIERFEFIEKKQDGQQGQQNNQGFSQQPQNQNNGGFQQGPPDNQPF